MRYRLETTHNASEITALIASAVDFSENGFFGKGAGDKLFFGLNKSDGFVLARNHRKSVYRFKVVIRNSPDGKTDLYIHYYPGLIHFVGIILLLFIIFATDPRTPVFNYLGYRVLFCIVIVAAVVIPNIVEYMKIKKELIDFCK